MLQPVYTTDTMSLLQYIAYGIIGWHTLWVSITAVLSTTSATTLYALQNWAQRSPLVIGFTGHRAIDVIIAMVAYAVARASLQGLWHSDAKQLLRAVLPFTACVWLMHAVQLGAWQAWAYAWYAWVGVPGADEGLDPWTGLPLDHPPPRTTGPVWTCTHPAAELFFVNTRGRVTACSPMSWGMASLAVCAAAVLALLTVWLVIAKRCRAWQERSSTRQAAMVASWARLLQLGQVLLVAVGCWWAVRHAPLLEEHMLRHAMGWHDLRQAYWSVWWLSLSRSRWIGLHAALLGAVHALRPPLRQQVWQSLRYPRQYTAGQWTLVILALLAVFVDTSSLHRTAAQVAQSAQLTWPGRWATGLWQCAWLCGMPIAVGKAWAALWPVHTGVLQDMLALTAASVSATPLCAMIAMAIPAGFPITFRMWTAWLSTTAVMWMAWQRARWPTLAAVLLTPAEHSAAQHMPSGRVVRPIPALYLEGDDVQALNAIRASLRGTTPWPLQFDRLDHAAAPEPGRVTSVAQAIWWLTAPIQDLARRTDACIDAANLWAEAVAADEDDLEDVVEALTSFAALFTLPDML